MKAADESGWAWGYVDGALDDQPKAYPANYVQAAKAPPPKLPPRPASKPKLKLKYAKCVFAYDENGDGDLPLVVGDIIIVTVRVVLWCGVCFAVRRGLFAENI